LHSEDFNTKSRRQTAKTLSLRLKKNPSSLNINETPGLSSFLLADFSELDCASLATLETIP